MVIPREAACTSRWLGSRCSLVAGCKRIRQATVHVLLLHHFTKSVLFRMRSFFTIPTTQSAGDIVPSTPPMFFDPFDHVLLLYYYSYHLPRNFALIFISTCLYLFTDIAPAPDRALFHLYVLCTVVCRKILNARKSSTFWSVTEIEQILKKVACIAALARVYTN